MKNYLIVALLLTSGIAFSQTKDSIPSTEASQHYNQVSKIYGTVSGGRWLEKSFLTFLNVDGNYPNHTLTILIKDSDRKKFGFAPENFFKGKNIVVEGKVLEFKDKPQINVIEPSQIRVVK